LSRQFPSPPADSPYGYIYLSGNSLSLLRQLLF
jgi:hypothetical protein